MDRHDKHKKPRAKQAQETRFSGQREGNNDKRQETSRTDNKRQAFSKADGDWNNRRELSNRDENDRKTKLKSPDENRDPKRQKGEEPKFFSGKNIDERNRLNNSTKSNNRNSRNT